MRGAYHPAGDLDGLLDKAAELSAKTLVFDVEPLVAYWDNGQDALDRGVAEILAKAAALAWQPRAAAPAVSGSQASLPRRGY